MIPQRWTPGSAIPARPGAQAAPPPGDIDWPQWSRSTERKRRLAARHEASGPPRSARAPLPGGYVLTATDASFRLDGLEMAPRDLEAALARGWGAKVFRPRQQQRVRNHVAILHRIERLLRAGESLKPGEVVRWYTSVACGLSTTQLDEPTGSRLDAVVRQVNSPHLRLCPAVQGVARLHRQMLADPVVPSFNGILARLLLRYHLGRCGLPPVIFVPGADGPAVLLDERRLLPRLMELIDASYSTMLGKE